MEKLFIFDPSVFLVREISLDPFVFFPLQYYAVGQTTGGKISYLIRGSIYLHFVIEQPFPTFLNRVPLGDQE